MAKQKIDYYSRSDLIYALIALGLLIYGLYSSTTLPILVGFTLTAIYFLYWGLRILRLKEYRGYQKYVGFRIIKGREVKLQATLHIVGGIAILLLIGYWLSSNGLNFR